MIICLLSKITLVLYQRLYTSKKVRLEEKADLISSKVPSEFIWLKKDVGIQRSTQKAAYSMVVKAEETKIAIMLHYFVLCCIILCQSMLYCIPLFIRQMLCRCSSKHQGCHSAGLRRLQLLSLDLRARSWAKRTVLTHSPPLLWPGWTMVKHRIYWLIKILFSWSLC